MPLRLFLLLFGFVMSAFAAPPELGIFNTQTDIGEPGLSGSASYDSSKQSYTVTGAGRDVWEAHDDFHFVHRRINGNFILQARARLDGSEGEAHRKFGLMARGSLDPASAMVAAAVHGDGLTSLQFRREASAMIEEKRTPVVSADVIQLERRGNRFILSVARFGDVFTTESVEEITAGDELEVGLFVCAHTAKATAKAIFDDVRLTIPAWDGLKPYKDYLGSRLELLTLESGRREVIYETPEGIDAPNWTPDGLTLIYNSRGKLFRFPIASGKPEPLDTGFAMKCNNDHVLSFDGKTLGISHNPKDPAHPDVTSTVYTMPVSGGKPVQVTTAGTSYLHGFSPNGLSLLFTGKRGGDFDIYRIPVGGGEETRLTDTPGLDDGSEYSPDGRFIYFNSTRSGLMQCWRMKPDGSVPEQLTHDDFNNWFPHVSPDGKRIVFITFGTDVKPDEHPYYQHVYLREMSADGGKSRVVAYLYGGQGTLNVPSWSPDGRRFAFVSHTAPVK